MERTTAAESTGNQDAAESASAGNNHKSYLLKTGKVCPTASRILRMSLNGTHISTVVCVAVQ